MLLIRTLSIRTLSNLLIPVLGTIFYSSITEDLVSSSQFQGFAGECIIRVWNHGAAVQPCKCPICRRLINLLVPANVSDEQNDDPQLQRVLGEIQHYNHIFGGAPRSLTQVYTLFCHEKLASFISDT